MGRLRKVPRVGKRGKVNTTSYGKKNKKKQHQKDKYTVQMSNIREKWNPKMTLKNNLRNLGLVYDINSDIKPYGARKSKESNQVEFMDIETAMKMETANVAPNEASSKSKGRKVKLLKKARTLREEFETRSKRPVRKTCHLSTAETEYMITLMMKHGTDYKMMFRDKDNYDQLTENQLRKKCQELLRSRETRHLKKFKELELIT